jgi:phenylacetate-coenzyme A ligase PaaK-like adenylate-forming protein
MSRRYWNEAVETINKEDLHRLERERLSTQIDYNYHASPFYRAKLDDAGQAW